MKRLSNITQWFHLVANEGKAITDYRNYHKSLSSLPAKRIEMLLQLRKLKQSFLKK